MVPDIEHDSVAVEMVAHDRVQLLRHLHAFGCVHQQSRGPA
jgi:hypothetical protein